MKAKSRNTLRVPGWFKRRKEGVRSRITHKIYQSFAPGLISIKISNTRRIDSKIELLFNQFAIWLMREQIVTEPIWRLSHPSRVRGLKYLWESCSRIPFHVAPFTGAWIEILGTVCFTEITGTSHPSRVRGLKFIIYHSHFHNKFQSHPSRVRGLKCQ